MDSGVDPILQPRLEHAKVWLRQARSDRATVERILGQFAQRNHKHLPRNPDTVVYLLQQAVEKAAKSLMFAAGKDEDTLRKKYSHNSLWVILEFIRQRFIDESYCKMFDSLLEFQTFGVRSATEALEATDDLIHKAKSRNLRELAVLQPEVMSVKIELMVHLYNQTVAKTNELLRPKTSVTVDPSSFSDTSAADYIMALATAAVRRDQLEPDVEAAVRNMIDPVALGWIETWRSAKGVRLSIVRDKVITDLVLPQLWALPALYMLAALTFPHEASSRYPAPFDAPADAIEASRCDKLGTQHYTDSLGIVTQLPALHRLTRLVLDNMTPLLIHAVEYSDDRQQVLGLA